MEQNSTSSGNPSQSRMREYRFQKKLSWYETHKWWIQTLGVLGAIWLILWLIITS